MERHWWMSLKRKDFDQLGASVINARKRGKVGGAEQRDGDVERERGRKRKRGVRRNLKLMIPPTRDSCCDWLTVNPPHTHTIDKG